MGAAPSNFPGAVLPATNTPTPPPPKQWQEFLRKACCHCRPMHRTPGPSAVACFSLMSLCSLACLIHRLRTSMDTMWKYLRERGKPTSWMFSPWNVSGKPTSWINFWDLLNQIEYDIFICHFIEAQNPKGTEKHANWRLLGAFLHKQNGGNYGMVP